MFVAIAKESYEDIILAGKVYQVVDMQPGGTFLVINEEGHRHYVHDEWLGFSLIDVSDLTQHEKAAYCMVHPQLEDWFNVHTG